jgi:hypothetical protein
MVRLTAMVILTVIDFLMFVSYTLSNPYEPAVGRVGHVLGVLIQLALVYWLIGFIQRKWSK